MGHGGDGRIFFNHYRALVQPAAAAEFWQIFPPAAALPAEQTATAA